MDRQRQKLYRVATVGKILEIGPRAIFARMRDIGALDTENQPTLFARQKGYLVEESRQWQYPNGGAAWYSVTLVTEAGLAWLRTALKERVP